MRVARTDRLDLVRALDRRIFREDDPVNVERGAWWLAWDGDRPVAFGGVRMLAREPDTAILSRCGVAMDVRGRGLQLRLIRARCRWAAARGARLVITYTDRENVASANNLIRAGFELYTPQWRYAGPDFLYWRRA